MDTQGRPRIVDVSSKEVTRRSATAVGKIYLNPGAFELVALHPTRSSVSENPISEEGQTDNQVKAKSKGDVLIVAQLAAIMAAKKTADLIPLCHPIPISNVSVSFSLDDANYSILCEATVECESKTGVEMEALTATSIGLLTVWDMLKAVAGKEMVITDMMVVSKRGGKSGDFSRLSDTQE